MTLLISQDNIGAIWAYLLYKLFHVGEPIKPRGIPCYELIGVTLHLTNARNNIIVDEIRDLNYRFMVAEWLYIWFGHHDVATIARYNKPIAAFSDNGVDFNGAYGPPVKSQWPRILDTLRADPDSRQAVLLIYRIPTGPTKDVPCTLTLQFFNRNGRLDTVATMRSSDVWLGLPYDVFNFTMLGNLLSAQLGLTLGSFTIHLGSSHLYDTNRDAAARIIDRGETSYLTSPQFVTAPPYELDHILTDPKLPWLSAVVDIKMWHDYARVLCSPTRKMALEVLREIK